MMPTMRWRAESAQFSKRHRQKATTTWQRLRWFHPSYCPQISRLSRLVGALTTHLIWQTCAVLKQGATTDCGSRQQTAGRGGGRDSHGVGRRQQAAGSRRRVNDDTLHVCQVGGNGSGSALNIDEGALWRST